MQKKKMDKEITSEATKFALTIEEKAREIKYGAIQVTVSVHGGRIRTGMFGVKDPDLNGMVWQRFNFGVEEKSD